MIACRPFVHWIGAKTIGRSIEKRQIIKVIYKGRMAKNVLVMASKMGRFAAFSAGRVLGSVQGKVKLSKDL